MRFSGPLGGKHAMKAERIFPPGSALRTNAQNVRREDRFPYLFIFHTSGGTMKHNGWIRQAALLLAAFFCLSILPFSALADEYDPL